MNFIHIPIYKPSRVVIYPPQTLPFFSFGYKAVLADIIWIRVFQDITFCEKGKLKCKKAWVYQMLDIVTELDPQFKLPFIAGGTVLSVLIQDKDGATALFDKGIERFPNDWQVFYRAAYHYLFEVKDKAKAAKLLAKAADNGAPAWVWSLSARLHTQEGELSFGLSLLKKYLKTLKDKKQIQKVQRRIRKLEEKLRVL